MKGLKRLNLITGLVLVTLLLVAGFYLRGLVTQQTPQLAKTILLNSESTCDLNQQGCIARRADKSLELRFNSPARYLTKFAVAVKTTGFDSQPIEKMLLDFSMPGMQMGINRFALHKVNDQNDWQGVAILPVCISGRKDWRVTLYVETKQASYQVIYNLLLEK